MQNDQGKVSEKNRKAVRRQNLHLGPTAEKIGSVSGSNVIALFKRSQQATGSSTIDGGQHGIQQGAGQTRYSSSSIHAVLIFVALFHIFSQYLQEQFTECPQPGLGSVTNMVYSLSLF